MHFHVLRLVLIIIIVYLVIHYGVWDSAVKEYDVVHTQIMRDVHSVQRQYFPRSQF